MKIVFSTDHRSAQSISRGSLDSQQEIISTKENNGKNATPANCWLIRWQVLNLLEHIHTKQKSCAPHLLGKYKLSQMQMETPCS